MKDKHNHTIKKNYIIGERVKLKNNNLIFIVSDLKTDMFGNKHLILTSKSPSINLNLIDDMNVIKLSKPSKKENQHYFTTRNY